MGRNIIKKISIVGVLLIVLSTIVSCEDDLKDIGTSIVKNTKFTTKDTILEVLVTPDDIDAVRADNIDISSLGEYLLGVYKKSGFKKVEASIVSQLGLPSGLNVKGSKDTIFTLDKVLIKLPYQATSAGKQTSGKPKFRIDSILGNATVATPIKVYRNTTFLNSLNPTDPSKNNFYLSNSSYSKADLLNDDASFTFVPNPNDTIHAFKRNLSTGKTFNDTIKLKNKTPFLVIPLNKTKMKQLFWDKFGKKEFSSSDALKNYFRGLILESTGNDGFMLPFSFTSKNENPTLDFYYTKTIFKDGNVKDTITGNFSFPLSGVRNSVYKMTNSSASFSGNFPVQGTAGSMAKVDVLQGTQVQDLRNKNWLVNDATITFYVDETKDTTNLPKRLLLYKKGGTNNTKDGHIEDSYKEGQDVYGGNLKFENKKPTKYSFKITSYISDLLRGKSNYNPTLGLKVFNNPTDVPVKGRILDTVVRTYNWNPRGVILLNHDKTLNGAKRATLKISYTIKNKTN